MLNPLKTLRGVVLISPLCRVMFAERFQMDFGFMKARSEQQNIRSHDGYNCYLLIHCNEKIPNGSVKKEIQKNYEHPTVCTFSLIGKFLIEFLQ